MYKHSPDLIKTLEIICSQEILNEDFEPEFFHIYKTDLEHQDISYHAMKSCIKTLGAKDYLRHLGFARLDLPYKADILGGTHPVQIIPDQKLTTTDGQEIVIKEGGFFHKDELANGLIMDDIWNILTKLKEGVHIDDIKSEYLSFNETESILKIGGHLIPISKRVARSHPHYLLTHIFETEKEEEYSFENLANLGVISDKTSQYHNACKDANKKINEKTKGEIPDFLEFDSKQVRINRKYIKD